MAHAFVDAANCNKFQIIAGDFLSESSCNEWTEITNQGFDHFFYFILIRTQTQSWLELFHFTNRLLSVDPKLVLISNL